jgi:hypothetical protein
MPDFRIPVNISPGPFKIAHSDHILLVGSCFTAHIGAYLQQRQFQVLVNPSGIIYNPVSLAKSITAKAHFQPTDFFEHEGRWRHWDLHSELAATDQPAAAQKANSAAANTTAFLQSADVLIITLGTASVFTLEKTLAIVANCHKMPSKLFQRSRLSAAATTDALSEAIAAVKAIRPEIKVILTVSPVRHLREGAVENQRSKAVLLLACEALEFQHANVFYFPAYELLLDDLRDYRFYGPDMVHPSETAVGYIWERFSETFFSEETQLLNARIEKIKTAAQHRPFNPESAQHQAFINKQLSDIAALKAVYPFFDFQEAAERFSENRK